MRSASQDAHTSENVHTTTQINVGSLFPAYAMEPGKGASRGNSTYHLRTALMIMAALMDVSITPLVYCAMGWAGGLLIVLLGKR
jgi:hypothetical protein